jgi:hypothetical protein
MACGSEREVRFGTHQLAKLLNFLSVLSELIEGARILGVPIQVEQRNSLGWPAPAQTKIVFHQLSCIQSFELVYVFS